MFDQSAIQQLTQAEATAQSNESVQHALTAGQPVVALHDEFNLTSLESYLPLRRRARNSMSTSYVEDFARYVRQHRENGCTIYVNAEGMSAKAVLNQGTPAEPGHGDNTALVKLKATALYTSLRNLVSQVRGQKVLAEWLEEWRDVVIPLDKDLGELNIGHVVNGIRSVSIEQLNKSTTTVEALSAERSEMESVAAKTNRADAVLPAFLKLTTKPYKELAERTFYVRVAILTSQREPTFSMGILGLELHEEQMAEEFAHVVRASFAPVADGDGVVPDQQIPDVLIGAFSVNS